MFKMPQQMLDQSSTHTIIVLEFNPAKELIDSEIIAVHRIVSNMKKRRRRLAGQKGGAVAPSTDD